MEHIDGRRARGDASRRVVLESAVDLASIDGLDGLTIGRLAAAANVSKSNVATLFGTKERLQLATVDAAAQRFRETVLEPDEIVTGVHIAPPAAGLSSAYLKFKERESFDFALASVAACVWRTEGKVSDARLVLGGVAPIPWRVPNAEKAIVGTTLSRAVCDEAAIAALAGAEPLAHNAYKVPLAKALVVRALTASLG